MAKSNPYFPCEFVEQDADYSVICSHFHYFDDHFGNKEVGGYTVERLAKKLVREHAIKGVKFDSEAGMFCAYSDKKGPLKQLCLQLRKITGGAQKNLARRKQSEPSIPLDQAEQLLIKGFVISLDEKAQRQFLKHVPCPALTPQQQKLLQFIQKGTDAEIIRAARKINSEARTLVRKWGHYLSHPETTKLLLDCCDANKDNAPVYQELIWALVFICDRHLPDLRAKPYFHSCLEHKKQQVRCLGIWGLSNLGVLNRSMLKPLLEDNSAKVRESAKSHLGSAKKSRRTFPSWMFDPKNVRQSQSK
ncbi:MAG: hypothetical protein GY904_25880 [Planctomycetaceae bacterium]|nr:hypothetical protein [Planctomycetaceae bacterium]